MKAPKNLQKYIKEAEAEAKAKKQKKTLVSVDTIVDNSAKAEINLAGSWNIISPDLNGGFFDMAIDEEYTFMKCCLYSFSALFLFCGLIWVWKQNFEATLRAQK